MFHKQINNTLFQVLKGIILEKVEKFICITSSTKTFNQTWLKIVNSICIKLNFKTDIKLYSGVKVKGRYVCSASEEICNFLVCHKSIDLQTTSQEETLLIVDSISEARKNQET